MKHLSRADEKLGFDPKRGKQAERRAAQRQSRKPILSPRPFSNPLPSTEEDSRPPSHYYTDASGA